MPTTIAPLKLHPQLVPVPLSVPVYVLATSSATVRLPPAFGMGAASTDPERTSAMPRPTKTCSAVALTLIKTEPLNTGDAGIVTELKMFAKGHPDSRDIHFGYSHP